MRAARRRRLLALGVSLTEQDELPRRDLDALLAVDDVIQQVSSRRSE